MNTITCDKCGKVSPIDGLMNWLHVEDIGVIVSFTNTGFSSLHFCGWHCLAEYADTKDQVVA